MKPKCHSRPPFAEGRWHYTGEYRRGKPVLRWYPRWFVDRCATHDGVGIGPNNENYPTAHGWDCTGCRWRPSPPATEHNFMGFTIVEDANLPPGVVAFSVPYSVGKSERALQFFRTSGDMKFLPDDDRRYFIIDETHEIDAFEPIWRSKQQ